MSRLQALLSVRRAHRELIEALELCHQLNIPDVELNQVSKDTPLIEIVALAKEIDRALESHRTTITISQ